MLELCGSLAGKDPDAAADSGFEELQVDDDVATEAYADSEPTEVVSADDAPTGPPKNPEPRTMSELLFEVRVYLKYQLYDRAVDALSRVLNQMDEGEEPDDPNAPFIDLNPEDDMTKVRSAALIKLLRQAEQTTNARLFILYDHFVNRRAAFVAVDGRICFGAHFEEEVYLDDEFAEARPELYTRLEDVPNDDLRAAVALGDDADFRAAREDALKMMARAFCSMTELFSKPIRVDQTQIEDAPDTLLFKPYEILLAAARTVDDGSPDAASEFYESFYDEATECGLVFNGNGRTPLPTKSKSVRSRSLEQILVFSEASRTLRRVRSQMQASSTSGFVIMDDDGFWACVTTRRRTALAFFGITALGRISKTLANLVDTDSPGPAPSPDVERTKRSTTREGRR